MSIKKTVCLVLLFSLLCTFLFPDVQGWLISGGRSRSHRYSWQQGKTMSRRYIGFKTFFDRSFTTTCTGFWQSMWNFQSAYESYHKDRVWLFHCQYDLKITPSCSWSGLVNNLGGSFSYTCPWNGHIAGMDVSTFNGVYKDRQFNFKCCHGTAPRKYCKWTSYAHGWNGDMDYKVQNGYYMAGASSYHSNYYEDRRWKFYICK